MRRTIALGTMALLLTACSEPVDKGGAEIVIDTGSADESAPESTTDSTATQQDDPDDVPEPDIREEDGPEFLELTTSAPDLTSGGFITISVQVTDPQGFADIGGGRVIDHDGNAYATFAGTAGSYTASLSWDGLDEMMDIDFGPGGRTLLLRAEFFDASNHRSFRDFEIQLHCDGESACSGYCGLLVCTEACAELSGCVDRCVASYELPPLDNDQNCGGCGIVCGAAEDCINGVCMPGELCDGIPTDTNESQAHCGECGNRCADNAVCVEGDCMTRSQPLEPCSPDDADACGPGGSCGFDGNDYCVFICVSDAECVGTSRCLTYGNLGFCAIPCQSESDCPTSQTCTDLGADPDIPFSKMCSPAGI